MVFISSTPNTFDVISLQHSSKKCTLRCRAEYASGIFIENKWNKCCTIFGREPKWTILYRTTFVATSGTIIAWSIQLPVNPFKVTFQLDSDLGSVAISNLPITLASHARHDLSDNRHPDCLFKSVFRRSKRKSRKVHITGHLRSIERWPHEGPVLRKRFPGHNVV